MSQELKGNDDSLFCNYLFSDVKFYLENENIEYPAHKRIIGRASDVLYNMVNGSRTTLPALTIFVPNYSSTGFLPVLKYIYTSELEWNLDNYDAVLAVGKYFGLVELEKLFRIYIATTVNYDNALDIYAKFHHKDDIVSRTSMKVIQLVLSVILKTENEMLKFFGLPAEALSQILNMDELGIENEEQLFQKMLIWSEKATIDQNSLSSVLGSQIKLIRFADMKIPQYSQFEEFLHAECNTRWKIKVFNKSTQLDISGNDDESQLINSEDKLEIIQITARHNAIRIHGLGLCLLPDAVYMENNEQFENIPFYSSKVFQGRYFDVMFENPIEIAKKTSLQLKVPTNSLRYYFKDEDSFFLQAIHRDKIVDNLPIAAIFVSMR